MTIKNKFFKTMNRYSFLTIIFLLSPINLYAQSFYKIAIGSAETDRVSNFTFVQKSAALTLNNLTSISDPSSDSRGNNFSFGIGKKYTNNSGLYFSPIISFDYFQNLSSTDKYNISHDINNRLSTALNIGYDYKNISIYYLSGISSTSYKTSLNSVNSQFFVDANSLLTNQNGKVLGSDKSRESSYISGLGVAYNISKDFSVGIEYNKQKISAATKHSFLTEGATFQTSNITIETYNLNFINNF